MNAAKVNLTPVGQEVALKDKVFDALRQAIVAMDIYAVNEAPRLDERKLAEDLGVSRTPVREALSRLEQEGLVTNLPRRGSFVVRKSKTEIIEIIQVWAAVESMAARLATQHASEKNMLAFEQKTLNYQSGSQNGAQNGAQIDEYSENNIRFHQDIIELSGNVYLIDTAKRSFFHMHAIRASTIRHPDRTIQSVIDHSKIIEAITQRNTTLAESLVRDHALSLAEHVRQHANFLD